MTKHEELYVRQQIACIRWNEHMQQKALRGYHVVKQGGRPTEVPVDVPMPRCNVYVNVPDVESARRYKRNQVRAFWNAVRVAQISKEDLIRAAAEFST